MKRKTFLLSIVILVFSISGIAQEFKVDTEKSTLKWHAKKVTGEHYGYINLKSGSFFLKENQFVNGEFIVDMTTISCEDLTDENWNNRLVGHLKSDDFFSVEKFNEAKLVLKESTLLSDNKSTIKGELTIKGITHPITFDVKVDEQYYLAKIIVDRTLYDVKYGSGKFFENLGDNMIDDEFTLKVKMLVK